MQQKLDRGSPQSRSAGPLPDNLKPPSAAPIAPLGRVEGEYSILLAPVRVYRNAKEYASGFKWDVVFDCQVLLKASRNPEFEACRALAKMGLAGKLATYHGDKPGMVFDIEKAAKVTISEIRAHGPRFALYKPFPSDLTASDSDAIGHFRPGEESARYPVAPTPFRPLKRPPTGAQHDHGRKRGNLCPYSPPSHCARR